VDTMSRTALKAYLRSPVRARAPDLHRELLVKGSHQREAQLFVLLVNYELTTFSFG
jgi:hypothetical protein